MYKLFSEGKSIYKFNMNRLGLGVHVDGDGMRADLIWHHSLAHRIHCMWYGDLTHDGLSELAIISTGGVHILQVRQPPCEYVMS